MKQHTLVLISLHICALLFGGTVQFSKLLPFSAGDIMVYRTFLCALILGVLALIFGHRLKIQSKQHLSLLLLCSVLFVAHWVSYFHAMQISTIAVGLISLFTFPVMTVFLEPLFVGGKPAKLDILMGLSVLVGVAFIAPEFSIENEVFLGVLFGLFSALTIAIRNIIISHWLNSYSPISVMFYHSLFGFVCVAPFISQGPSLVTGESWLLFVIFALVFTCIPHTQITHGLKFIPAKTVSMILSLQVVYASILAYLIFEEALNLNTLAGGTLILGASIVETLRAKPRLAPANN